MVVSGPPSFGATSPPTRARFEGNALAAVGARPKDDCVALRTARDVDYPNKKYPLLLLPRTTAYLDRDIQIYFKFWECRLGRVYATSG
jgi:hypothetical protein